MIKYKEIPYIYNSNTFNPFRINNMPGREQFRIDKNVAHNIDHIATINSDNKLVNADGILIKQLIYYFSHTYQNNIFGFGTLDPYDFCEKFGYEPGYLRSRHNKPLHLIGKNQEEIDELYDLQDRYPEERVFDSVLENALFLLMNKPLIFKRGAKTVSHDGDKIVYDTNIKSYVLITELNVSRERNLKRRGDDKVLYNYQLDKRFIDNLSHYYLNSNIKSLVRLKSTGLDELYLYLSNLRETLRLKGIYGTTVDQTPSFELLATDLCHIPKTKKNGEPYEPKYRKRDLIKNLKQIQEKSELDFEFDFVKGPKQRYAFTPIFNFKKKEVTGDERIAERKRIFNQNLSHELLNVFRRKRGGSYYHQKRETYFLNWLRKTDIDIKEKELAYENAYFSTYGEISKYIDNMKSNFLKKCSSLENIKDLEKH